MDEKVPFSVKELFDLVPSYESRIRVKGFQPSRAVGIRVGDESTILTFEEFKELAKVLHIWMVTNE